MNMKVHSILALFSRFVVKDLNLMLFLLYFEHNTLLNAKKSNLVHHFYNNWYHPGDRGYLEYKRTRQKRLGWSKAVIVNWRVKTRDNVLYNFHILKKHLSL